MINIYKTIDGKIVEIDEIEKHAWINMVNPTEEELLSISDQLNVEEDFLRAALDEEEISRVELDEDMNQALITIDVPIVDKTSQMVLYSTIPVAWRTRRSVLFRFWGRCRIFCKTLTLPSSPPPIPNGPRRTFSANTCWE